MKTLLSIACVYSLFVAVAGFLFGQAFFGNFSLPATVAGTAGTLAAVAGFRLTAGRIQTGTFAFWCAIAGLVGVAMDAANYYINLNAPGNYYAWFLNGPFCVALLFIAYTARKRSAQS